MKTSGHSSPPGKHRYGGPTRVSVILKRIDCSVPTRVCPTVQRDVKYRIGHRRLLDRTVTHYDVTRHVVSSNSNASHTAAILFRNEN